MQSNYFKNYLLGLLSAFDAEALEVQIISNEVSEDDLISAENRLIEDYLANNLNEDEVKAFQNNYLVTNERLERVELTKSLIQISDQTSEKLQNIVIKPNFFNRLKDFFSLRPLTVSFATIALILSLGLVWQIVFNTNRTQVGAEIAALNKQDLSNLEEFKTFTKLNLAKGILRSDGNSNNLLENQLTEKVLISLILPVKTSSVEQFNVKIVQNGKQLQQFTQRSYENQEVRLLLPKSLLKKGEYQITLENKGEEYNYSFVVQ